MKQWPLGPGLQIFMQVFKSSVVLTNNLKTLANHYNQLHLQVEKWEKK